VPNTISHKKYSKHGLLGITLLQTQDVLDSYDVIVSGLNEALSRLLSNFESSHDDAVIYEQDNFRAFECQVFAND